VNLFTAGLHNRVIYLLIFFCQPLSTFYLKLFSLKRQQFRPSKKVVERRFRTVPDKKNNDSKFQIILLKKYI
jgi:hypothetical protein